ncbi:uncharacterized protein (TIGR02284 family) [Oxalobacteraceae bacterium GrIS 2.11]
MQKAICKRHWKTDILSQSEWKYLNHTAILKGRDMDNQDVISVLNTLIETCKDGEASYTTCAKDAGERNSPLQPVYADIRHRCAAAASELQALVVSLAGEPSTEGSTAEAIHRGWVNLKHALGAKSDEAVLAECERGEDAAKKQYHLALEHDLPAQIRTVVERQSQGVLANHDKIKSLRDRSDHKV